MLCLLEYAQHTGLLSLLLEQARMKLEDVNITDELLRGEVNEEEDVDGSDFDYNDSGYDYSDEDE